MKAFFFLDNMSSFASRGRIIDMAYYLKTLKLSAVKKCHIEIKFIDQINDVLLPDRYEEHSISFSYFKPRAR